MTNMKKLIVVATVAMAALSVGSTAFAGEVGGSTNGKAKGPKATQGIFLGEHARSICAFSGLADGGEGEPAGPGNVQNWGHVDRAEEPSPGFACNGAKGFLSGGGEE
jgi:hypothetical protein